MSSRKAPKKARVYRAGRSKARRRKGGGSGLAGLLKGPVGLVLLGVAIVLGVGYAAKWYQGDVLDLLPKSSDTAAEAHKVPAAQTPATDNGGAAPAQGGTTPPAAGNGGGTAPASGTGQTAPATPAGQEADPNAAILADRAHIDRSAGAKPMLVTVYYADGLKNGDTLVPVQVQVPLTVSTVRTAAEQVVRAPENLKLYSNVPAGTKVQDVNFKPDTGVATVDLSGEAANVQGTAAAQSMMASFVYTLTELPNVKAVQLWVNGRPAVLHGIEWSKPLSRQDLQAQNPLRIDPVVKFVAR